MKGYVVASYVSVVTERHSEFVIISTHLINTEFIFLSFIKLSDLIYVATWLILNDLVPLFYSCTTT